MKNPEKITVLICDDHNLVRQGIAALLKEQENIKVIGEASNGYEAIKFAQKYKPDVILMDLSMPTLNGLEATSKIKKEFPDIKILILTQHENDEYVVQMIRAGASGYVLKTSVSDDLINGIKEIIKGQTFFSSSISKMILEDYVKKAKGISTDTLKTELTQREKEVLKLIAEGATNQEAADKLFISVRTVEFHRANIMHKLKISDLAGLVKYAIQKGIIKIENIEEKI